VSPYTLDAWCLAWDAAWSAIGTIHWLVSRFGVEPWAASSLISNGRILEMTSASLDDHRRRDLRDEAQRLRGAA
jgi:hypothetical protein